MACSGGRNIIILDDLLGPDEEFIAEIEVIEVVEPGGAVMSAVDVELGGDDSGGVIIPDGRNVAGRLDFVPVVVLPDVEVVECLVAVPAAEDDEFVVDEVESVGCPFARLFVLRNYLLKHVEIRPYCY